MTVIGAGITSMAGVYTEWVMKRRAVDSFAVQNMQLYAYGIVFSGIALWSRQGEEIAEVHALYSVAAGVALTVAVAGIVARWRLYASWLHAWVLRCADDGDDRDHDCDCDCDCDCDGGDDDVHYREHHVMVVVHDRRASFRATRT